MNGFAFLAKSYLFALSGQKLTKQNKRAAGVCSDILIRLDNLKYTYEILCFWAKLNKKKKADPAPPADFCADIIIELDNMHSFDIKMNRVTFLGRSYLVDLFCSCIFTELYKSFM